MDAIKGSDGRQVDRVELYEFRLIDRYWRAANHASGTAQSLATKGLERIDCSTRTDSMNMARTYQIMNRRAVRDLKVEDFRLRYFAIE